MSTSDPEVFTKSRPDAPAGFFAREAAGLTALASYGARVPEVLELTDTSLTITRIADATVAGPPVDEPEKQFGRELATLHRTSAADAPGYFGGLDRQPQGFLGDQASGFYRLRYAVRLVDHPPGDSTGPESRHRGATSRSSTRIGHRHHRGLSGPGHHPGISAR
ncbi:hypothetical protein [Auritidibacter ignavus]|uniref:hypothetical protein n=1 Tax=Auritidibacter ignavus TaxID=678932 RepID=UPI0016B2301E|nr:hypothetical protein [Auritidibacter ignavus]NIH72171.1 hypothetical protein [Auritidibacter ignavus]